jgi:hypothetical protein
VILDIGIGFATGFDVLKIESLIGPLALGAANGVLTERVNRHE